MRRIVAPLLTVLSAFFCTAQLGTEGVTECLDLTNTANHCSVDNGHVSLSYCSITDANVQALSFNSIRRRQTVVVGCCWCGDGDVGVH